MADRPVLYPGVGLKPHIPPFFENPAGTRAAGDIWAWDATYHRWYRTTLTALLAAGNDKVLYVSHTGVLTWLALGAAGTALLGNGAAAAPTFGRIPRTLFDHFADAGNLIATGETDLYADTLTAGLLASNGDKVTAEYGGIFVSSGTATRQIKVYACGSLVFDSGALSISAGADAWDCRVLLVRVSASAVRCVVSMTLTGAALNAFCAYTAVTGLTLANAQVLKVTGTAAGIGAADNDIVAKLGSLSFVPAA